MFGQAAGLAGAGVGVQDNGARRQRLGHMEFFPLALARRGKVVFVAVGSDGQSSPSYRFTGAPGMMVEIACL